MHDHPRQFSLADLSAAGIRLEPADAVAIALGIVTQVRQGHADRIPSSVELRFDSSGRILIGAGSDGVPTVEAAGRLLDDLLPPFDDPTVRVPGALRIAVARALGTLDLPPYPSLEAFAAAVDRFSAGDSAATIRSLAAA
jgi:hypothetical protein